ncbi:hypothetical protein CALVIDRAFT_534700 [Calocera viscosa TUFC12733]|uniref:Uncharacterized protein n=1 Tax=Calocera viscosa (strain TUFC12733) TaxID=1330018 RepID=A0A167PV72_CALVF|nr:hypothetical protein CALVIDRAFT_534700 [Calocera viscosa TUFC12733]
MASPAPSRKPGHHSTTYTLAPPPPPPNWSQTPTPGGVMPYPYSYPQPARTIPHHAVGASPGPPMQLQRSPHQRRGSAGSTGAAVPPPKPLGLPETRDFFSPPTTTVATPGKGSGRITPQNDPHRRALYLPPSGSPEGSESGDEYGLEDQPWGEHHLPPAQRGAGAGGIMGAVASLVAGRRLTDDEEALRAREESRREAERILALERGRMASQSASELERQDMEDEVLRMLGTPSKSPRALPPTTGPATPSGATTPGGTPMTPGTPKSSNGNPGWWTAAKARLTPSKAEREMTPAQMVVAEARGGKLRKQRSSSVGASDREREGREGKGRTSWFSPRSSESPGKEWPAKGEKKYDDPAFALLGGSAGGGRISLNGPPTTGPQPEGGARARTQSLPPRAQAQGHLSAPGTPHGPPTTHAHSQQPSMHSAASPAPSFLSSLAPGGGPGRSPYLSHLPSGALNMPDSLLSMASRLEKLERWTVAHVRALEERMREVEEYIVGREGAWDAAESGVVQLRAGLAELRASQSLREPPAPEDTELGRAINSAWRKEHGLPEGGSGVPATRERGVARVVSSVKSSEDDLRTMAQAQRAEVGVKPPGGNNNGNSNNSSSSNTSNGGSNINTSNGNTNGNGGTNARLGPPTTAGQADEDRVSLSGLADTLTDYSRMFLPDGMDVSRNTSLARSAASDDLEGDQQVDAHGDYNNTAHRERDVEVEDVDADAGSIASDATEAAHSLHSGSGSLAETGPRTPPPTTSLPLPSTGSPLALSNSGSPGSTPLAAAAGRLPRPVGDYVKDEQLRAPQSVGREDREGREGHSPGRRRYTAALGGKDKEPKEPKADKYEKANKYEREQKDGRKEEKDKPLLPTPDTPGTEKFESSPEKVVRPKAQRAHTTSYSVSSSPGMPHPSPAPSVNGANASTNAGAGAANTTAKGEFFTTTRPRPRPHSTYAPLSNQSPAPIKIPPTHARPKQVGLGFVDPLVIRKEVKDAGREVKSLEGLKAVRAGKKTAKVGEMVKFFDKQ